MTCMARLTPEQQLIRARARLAQIESKVTEQNRRRETRLKVLLGVSLLGLLSKRGLDLSEVKRAIKTGLSTKSKSKRLQQRAELDIAFVLAELDRRFQPPADGTQQAPADADPARSSTNPLDTAGDIDEDREQS